MPPKRDTFYITPKGYKKKWLIDVEDLLYFQHNVPSSELEQLALQAWDESARPPRIRDITPAQAVEAIMAWRNRQNEPASVG